MAPIMSLDTKALGGGETNTNIKPRGAAGGSTEEGKSSLIHGVRGVTTGRRSTTGRQGGSVCSKDSVTDGREEEKTYPLYLTNQSYGSP